MNFKPKQKYYLVSDYPDLVTAVYVGPFKGNYDIFYICSDSDELNDYKFIYLDAELKKVFYIGDAKIPLRAYIYDTYEEAKQKVRQIEEIHELRQKARILTDEQLLALLKGKI